MKKVLLILGQDYSVHSLGLRMYHVYVAEKMFLAIIIRALMQENLSLGFWDQVRLE